MEELEVCVDG